MTVKPAARLLANRVYVEQHGLFATLIPRIGFASARFGERDACVSMSSTSFTFQRYVNVRKNVTISRYGAATSMRDTVFLFRQTPFDSPRWSLRFDAGEYKGKGGEERSGNWVSFWFSRTTRSVLCLSRAYSDRDAFVISRIDVNRDIP